MLWAKIDQAGVLRWADPLDPKKGPRGALSERHANEPGRSRDPEALGWKRAQFPDKDGDFFSDLFTDWAGWGSVSQPLRPPSRPGMP